MGATLASLALRSSRVLGAPSGLRRFWRDIHELSADLKAKHLDADSWQERLSLLFANISPEEVAAEIEEAVEE